MTNAGYRPPPYAEPGGGYGPPGAPHDERAGPTHANVALYLILTLATLGLFGLYWNWRQMKACNGLLRRKEFSWILWILLSVITFGIYHFYYQYKMGAAINEIQDRVGMRVTEGLPVLSVLATLIGFGIVTDCIHQYELNRIAAVLARGEGV